MVAISHTIVIVIITLAVLSLPVLSFQCVKNINYYTSSSIRSLVLYSTPSSTITTDNDDIKYKTDIDPNDWDSVVKEVNLYLAARETTSIPDIIPTTTDTVTTSSVVAKASYTALEMFRPTGWYKDTYTIDLKSRSNPRAQAISHPLSYIELQRYGYDHLIEVIIQLGGPYVVGKKMGIDFVEPKKVVLEVPEALRPVRKQNYALDTRGSLMLGNALDDRLDEAANLDMDFLKKRVKENADDDGITDGMMQSNSRNSNGDFDDDIDYTNRKKKIAKKRWVNTEKAADRSERFSLDGLQRVYFLVLVAAFSVAFGHASMDMETRHIGGDLFAQLREVSKALSIAFISSSIFSCIYTIKEVKEKKRSGFTWGLKALLGGPLTVKQLSQLDVIVDDV